MRESGQASPRIARRFAIVSCLVAVLLPASAPALAGGKDHVGNLPPKPKSISWSGEETFVTSQLDRDGSAAVSYKVDLKWRALWSYDPATRRLMPSSDPGSVTGTATRFVDGQTACTGPVKDRVGTPGFTIDRAGIVTFTATAIPGWPGSTQPYACYGPVVPPVLAQFSAKKLMFDAKAQLSSLIAGTASASDSNSVSNTSTYQGSVCTKGCIPQTAQTANGYAPVGGGAKPKPNPSDPIYTDKTSLSWSAKVSLEAAPREYVALGDSYSAADGAIGKGVESYSGACHKTPAAYPELLGIEVKKNMACSGATIDTMSRPFKGEGAQLSALDENTALVTITIGGNDVKMFALTDCMTSTLFKLLGANGTQNAILQSLLGCKGRFGGQVASDLQALPGRLAKLYEAIHAKAPDATLLVLEYPNPFPSGNLQAACASEYGQANLDFGGLKIPVPLMVGIDHADFPFLYETINNINTAIEQGVAQAHVDDWSPTLVPMSGAGVDFQAHNVCTFDSWFWGFRADKSGEPLGATLHPNLAGNQAMATLVKRRAGL